MDIQKEKEAFEAWFESRYGAHFMQFALDLDFYVDKHTQTCWEAWQAVPKGFVLVPQESLKVALFWMHEDIDPWQMGGDSFADLYEHKPILEKALVEAQEPTND